MPHPAQPWWEWQRAGHSSALLWGWREKSASQLGKDWSSCYCRRRKPLKHRGTLKNQTFPKAGGIPSSEEKAAFPELQTIFSSELRCSGLLGGVCGGGSSSDCCGQTTFARELFHMSERLAGVVSLSDSSAASVSASRPLAGIMVNPQQRGCLQRERGESLLM